jgi:hypothetical protein
MACVDNLSVTGQRSPEPQSHGVRALNVSAVDRLYVDVRLGAVAGVPAATEEIADPYALPRLHRHAALLEVADRNDDTVALDQHVIAGERYPARFGSAALRQRVTDRGQAAIGLVVGVGAVCGCDDAIDGCEHRPSESRESLRRFRPYEGGDRDRRCSPGVVDRYKVDRV